MRRPKTVTFFSALGPWRRIPRRDGLLKIGWREAMTDDMKLSYSNDCEDASNPIYEHWLDIIHFMTNINHVLHRFVFYYSGSEATVLR